jgi:hypothetical protein
MIRELRDAFPTAKIVAISGDRGRLAAAQTFSQCTFEKPLYMEELLDAVRQFASAPEHPLFTLQPSTPAAIHSVQGAA